MAMDVIDLRQFYASAPGGLARRAIAAAIAQRWPNVQGLHVFGVGYAPPYLNDLAETAGRAIALMPGRQGVLAWPAGGLSNVGLVEPLDLPLRDSVVDRLLVVHALEMSEDAHALMEEFWRVLTPGGHMIVVAPNRRGAWSRRDSTPFGYGQPYSRAQLTALLRAALFTPVHWQEALYFPPSERALAVRLAPLIESVGAFFKLPFAGVHIIEATKQIYRPALARRSSRSREALAPALAPSAGRDAVEG